MDCSDHTWPQRPSAAGKLCACRCCQRFTRPLPSACIFALLVLLVILVLPVFLLLMVMLVLVTMMLSTGIPECNPCLHGTRVYRRWRVFQCCRGATGPWTEQCWKFFVDPRSRCWELNLKFETILFCWGCRKSRTPRREICCCRCPSPPL